MLKLNDIFPNWYALSETGLQGGFFTQLYTYLQTSHIECDFLPDTNTAYLLDIEYHGNISGQKPIAPLPQNMLIDNALTSHSAQRIAGLFWAMYGEYCKKQFAVLSAEYNPIENYRMEESGTDTDTGTHTTTKSGKETREQSGQTQSHTVNDFGKYGFDSVSSVNADKSDTTTTNTIGLDNAPLKDELSFSDRIDETEIDTEHGHEMTRSGNIGVTTSQQMLQSEIDLWKWNFYTEFLFPCANRILTLPIY